MSERPEDPELRVLEAALRDLRPKPDNLNRTVLMYQAGRASVRGWGWPTATAFSLVLALTLGTAWWVQPAPAVVERIVYVAAPSPQPDGAATARENQDHPSPEALPDDAGRGAWARYVRMQEQILNHGLEGLPSPSGPPEEPLNLESLLHSS